MRHRPPTSFWLAAIDELDSFVPLFPPSRLTFSFKEEQADVDYLAPGSRVAYHCQAVRDG